jgi:hypothetical protein
MAAAKEQINGTTVVMMMRITIQRIQRRASMTVPGEPALAVIVRGMSELDVDDVERTDSGIRKRLPQYAHSTRLPKRGSSYGAPQLGQLNSCDAFCDSDDIPFYRSQIQNLPRHIHRREQALNNAVCVQALDFCFGFQENAMTQDGQSDSFHIIGDYITSPLHRRICF